MAEENKKFSQLDMGGVLKSAHEDKNKSLRVTSANTSVPAQYSRVELTYNASDSVTNAKFYEGTLAEIRDVTFTGDIAGSLNNTYFTLYSENDESTYHVWYNVSGGGTDPAPVGSYGIEIPIETNDVATIVKLATQRCLEQFIDEFKVVECAPTRLKITNARMGVATNAADFGTGFTIVTPQEGEEKFIKSVDVPFDGKNKYGYNTQEKRFEIFPIADTTVELSGEIDVKNPNSIVMLNETIALKNVENSIALPTDVKRIHLKSRNAKAKLQISFVSGESGTLYYTVPRGFVWDSYEIDIADGSSIYVQSSQDATDLELIVWRRI